MHTSDRSRISIVLSVYLSTSLAACGADVDTPATSESAGALTASSTYLVSFAGGQIPANAAAIVGAAGGALVARYTNVGLVLARASSSGFAQALRADARVAAVGASRAVSSTIDIVKAEKMAAHPVKPQRAPGSDPLSNRQWDMDQIHAPAARAINAGKKSVLVGVLDSGIDVTHPDLAGQVDMAASASCVGGVANPDPAVWANDFIGHGTHVSGTIAGAKNGVGIVGVAPGVKLAGVKLAVDDINDPTFGEVFADAFVCAIDWAIGHDFDVMNASLTIDPFTGVIDDIFCSDQPDRAAIVQMVRKAVLASNKRNITLVASMGNFFLDLANLHGATPGSTCQVLPAELPGVIGVSSVGYTQKLAFYADYGKGAVDLTAPGGDSLIPDPRVTDTTASGQVLSSVPPGSFYYGLSAQWNGQVQDCSSGTCSTYAYIQGESQAAPHVTGVAALAISRFGRLPPDLLLGVLSLTAKPLRCPPSPYDPGMSGMPATCAGTPLYNNFYGAGEVDALAVVR
jgi:subtilisin family serine protease